MKINQHMRLIMAVGVVFASVLFLIIAFYAVQALVDLAISILALPDWLFYMVATLVTAFIVGSGWLAFKLLVPKKAAAKENKAINEETLRAEIDELEQANIETQALIKELEELNQRRESGKIHIAFFGDVSTGKSSIIKALIPEANVKINLQGGSTREIHEYSWSSEANDQLVLTDLPGRNEADGELDKMSQDEAIRAQIVVYVTDSDLTRTQYGDVKTLIDFGKPMIMALNKSDQYTDHEKSQLEQRIKERFPESTPKVVFIQSGGEEEVLKVYPDGREETITRPRKPQVNPLAYALQNTFDQELEWLSQLRDVSVFTLVKQKVDETRITHRREQGEKIVSTSTKQAVVGAMAAVSPGMDIVIQGVIGVKMVKQLCALYDAPVNQIDIDKFLDFSQGQAKKSIPLVLAVVGNGLKAFPGIGTLAGGMTHAVAYGLIFDSLGKAVLKTLEERGDFKAAPAALTFREMLSENLEERTKTFARLVIDHHKSSKKEGAE